MKLVPHVKYEVSLTITIHIICDHLEHYLDKTKQSLEMVRDQVVEASHKVINKRFTESRYYLTNINHPDHGKMLLQGVNYVNAYNL